MENNILNGENSENLNHGNSSFFDEKVSSSNSNEGYPKLRFKDPTSCWKNDKLGSSCNVMMCKRIFAHQTQSNGEIPFYKIGTIGSNPDAYISKELFEEYKEKYNYPRINEVMITCAGTVGRCWQFDGTPSYYQDSNIVWIDNPQEVITNNFIYRLLERTDWSKLNSTTITRIYNDNLRELNCCYPNKSEQNKITDFLLLIDKRIEKQRLLIKNLKKYKRGLLSAIFERKIQFSNNEIWLEKKLKEVCNGFDNQRKPISAELREKGLIPYYGANGIQDYVKDYIFDGEYVLLAEDGGHFDEFSTMPIAQFINGKAWVNNHAHILQGKDTYNTKFIYYALVHKDIRKYINGTSRAKLNQEDMWDIKIIVPSFKLQIEIVEYFSKLDENIKAQENCLKNLEYLKKGFLQQMFI